MKRVLSMFLAIVMVVSLFTISVVPATAEIAETPSTETNMGVGDVSEGYTPTGTAITTAEGFAGMEANGTYYLAKDITLTASYAGTFTGTFDGNGYTITLAGYAAFNNTQNATIKNLKLTGQVTNAVSNYMAAVTNSCTGGTFANIYTDADISSEASGVAAGGIFAVNYDGAIKVENCTNAGDIKVADIAAGIAAKPINDAAGKTAEFIGCINTGNITSTGSYAGGIIARGRQVNTVERCLNTGTITANGDQASGIVGYHWSNGLLLTIANCVNVGDIVNNKTNKFACGILGGSGATSKITVTNNLNIGALTGTYTYSQINYLSGATITSRGNYYLSGNAAASNSYTTGMITLSNDKLAGGEVTYKINSILGRNFFYQTIGTDAEPVYMDNTHGVVFYNDRLNTYANEAAVNPAIGDVASGYTPEAAAEAITTTEGFVGMNANGNYYLESDITLTEASPYFDGCFTGTFDGNGYTITLAGYAAFRSTTGATIKNLKLAGEVTSAVDATITNGSGASKTYSNYLGTVTQASGGGTFQNIVNNANVTNTSGINGGAGLIGLNDGVLNIINCINNGNIKVNGTAAGIISHPEIDTQTTLASVIGCTNNGRVESTASYAGGIIARGRWDNYVERCVNNGNITANSSQAAGIVAYHYGGWGAKLSDLTITKCMNTGDITCNVTGTKIAAGILGITDGAISNSYSPTVYNKLEITYNLNTGKLVGSSMRGIVNVHNGHVSTAFTCFGNYYIEGPSATNNTAVAADAFVSFNADELASGKVAYDLNKALGATPVFYQSISTNGDKAPVLDSTHGTVSLIDGKYTNGYITTVAEFAAMSATGSYILANDIDLSTLATPYYDGCFKGNFDGNGKTITLAGYSLFRSTSGATIKNLKLTGEVTGYANNYSDADPHESAKWNYGGDKFVAAVTAVTRGGTFENIFTDASITCTEAGVGAGGIFGVNDYGAVTVKNCTNAGNIDVVDIAAGIAARPQENDTTNVATFTECINTGNITSAVYAGGIIARGRHNNTVEKCLNAGKITSNCTGTNPAGGIVANYWSNNAKNTIKIEKCVNIGDVEVSTSGFSAGGILGNTTANVNSATPFTLIFNYNINIGTVSGTRARSLLNTNNGEVKYTAEGNYYLKAGSQLPTYNTTNSNGSGLMISFTADELASGEYTYKINTEILGKTVLYQAIGVDAAPSLDSTRGVVAHNADTNTYSNVGLLGSAITSAEEFAAMDANELYYLANDIDLSTLDTKYYNGCFKGIFDGNGKTVKLAGYSLFRSTEGATIKNLNLSGSVENVVTLSTANGDPYESTEYVAAVTHATKGGVFENITNNANIENISGTAHAGAIYGINDGANVSVTNCKNTGTINVSGHAGGIVAHAIADGNTSNTVTIKACINTGTVTSSGKVAGGIIGRGRNNNTIEGCINTGAVTSSADQAGGILAFSYASNNTVTLSITKCVNTGTIKAATSGGKFAGGILGNAGGTYKTFIIKNNANVGTVSGASKYSLFAYSGTVTSESNYYLNTSNATNNSSIDTSTLIAFTAAQVKSGEATYKINTLIFEGTVFYQTIDFDDLPVLDNTHGVIVYDEATDTYGNAGVSGGAITSAAEFAAMSANGLYYLANDIDLSTLGTKYYNGCFKGMLDGNGHTITLAGYPLFRSTHGATITNLKLSGSVTNAIVCTTAGGDPGDYNSSGDIYIAAVAPVTRGGIFDNITNAANISNTTGTVHAGAIYGVNHWDSVTVINCKNTGNVRVSGFAGGIVGRALTDNDTSSLATISGCVNSGSIESTASYAGGIVSRTRHKTLIEKCVNTGGVLAHKDQAAGIVAFHWGQGAALTITQCVNLGDITCDIGDANSVEMACGILGNAGGSSYADNALTFTYNINAGKLYGNLLRSLLNTNDSKLVYTSIGNYYRVGVEASNNSVTTAGMTAVISKKLSSGELAIELNDMIGETVFYQTLGVDKAPVADSTHGVVHNIKGNYTNSDHHFAGVNITLDSNIKVKYYVHNFEYSHSPQMRFTINGKSVTVDGTLNAQTKYYEFVFEGVAPQCIGDNIKAELLVNGEVISEKDNYSVLTYLRALKAKSMETLGYGYDKYESMMTLVDNLLVYGGAAQGYINHNTNDLVSTNVPDKVTYAISGTDKSATNDSKVSWKSGSVVFDSVNKIVIRFTAADVAGLSFTVKINDGEATPIEYTPAGANTYAITTDAIYATGFNDVYTITASTGATVTYSVRSYVYSMKDDANVKDLVLATYSYGEAAKAFNGEKTTAQVISEIDKTTNQKISNIVNNVHDTLVPEKFTGTKYYVAANGNDSNNGTSASTPWKTLSKVNSANLGSGSAVFFRRGDTFRGNIVAQAGVTYAAYGEGAKPIIIANTITDANQTGSWSNYNGTSNIWVYHKTIADQGNIIFNDGIACGYKVTPSYKNSTAYVQWSENKTVFDVATGLDKDLSFVWIAESGFTSAGVPNTKTATGKLYLRCDAGNPASVYSQSIEFAPNVFTIDAYANNVRVDNLCLKYTGAHAIGGGYDTDTNEALKDLIVTNCEIGWIGGSVLYYKDQSNETGIPVRYGNAVQAIGGVNNYLVQHNYIYHIYDAGITHQIGEGTNDVVMQKITYADNVILYCSYSVEYFLGEATGGATRYMANVVVRDNIMRYAGLGFGNQRPDKYNAAHIKGWGLHPNYLQSGSTFSIRNNVFDRSRYMMVHCGAANEGYLPTFENNVWIQYDSMTSVLGGYATNGNMNTEVAFTKANVTAIETGAECYIVTEDDQWFLPF